MEKVKRGKRSRSPLVEDARSPLSPAESAARGRGVAMFDAYFQAHGRRRFDGISLHDHESGKAILEATPEELVGVSLAATAHFSRVAQNMLQRTENYQHNIPAAIGYQQRVAELLVRLYRKNLPYRECEFVELASGIGAFPFLHLYGCLHFSFFVSALERFVQRAGVGAELAACIARLQACFLAARGVAETKLAHRCRAILENYGRVPARPEGGSNVERLLLERESARIEWARTLFDRMLAALHIPAEGDTTTPVSFDTEAVPEHRDALAIMNRALAEAPWNSIGYTEREPRSVALAAKLEDPEGRGLVAAVAALAALSQRRMPYIYDDPRTGRYHSGATDLLTAIWLLMPTVQHLDPRLFGEVCHAASVFKEVKDHYFCWEQASRLVARHADLLLGKDADPLIVYSVLRLRERIAREHVPRFRPLANDIDRSLGIDFDTAGELGERWSDRMYLDLQTMKEPERLGWMEVLRVCAKTSSAAPTGRWLKEIDAALSTVSRKEVTDRLGTWFLLVGKPRPMMPGGKIEGRDSSVPSERGADLLRGLAWMAARYDEPRMAQYLGDLAMACYKMVPGIGARCIKPGTGAVWALSQMNGVHALSQLSRIRQLVKFGTAKKVLDATLERLATSLNLSTDELHEVAAPDFGLDASGRIREEAGEFVLELGISPDGAALRIFDSGGSPRKSIPAVVKRDHAGTLKELKAVAVEIDKMLPAQKDRLERLFHDERTWSGAAWRERYADHPLVGTIARRLIWTFTSDGVTRCGIWDGGAVTDEAGRSAAFDERCTVALWHPIGEDAGRVAAWRTILEERQIRQPFKQAHRECYVLTDPERQTSTYSNRFAGHIIRQAQLNALCQTRGWKHTLFVLEYGDPVRLRLPRWDLEAHFVVSPIGDEMFGAASAYAYLQTDRVYFTHIGDAEPVNLERVPARPFSEAMRDVDLFIGVGSIGMDPNWTDAGHNGFGDAYWQAFTFGDLTPYAQTRRELLARLVPRLGIAGVSSLDERFLIVRGKLRTYKIHLGSGNILMAPNDEYLCIVPASVSRSPVFLPFEGDQTLAVILSKAFMLAADDQIKDPTVLRQIRRVE